MSVLQELWYGNIRPNEDKTISEEEKKLVKSMTEYYEILSSTLNDKMLETYKKHVNCFSEYASLIESEAFEIGFKLAVNLLTE